MFGFSTKNRIYIGGIESGGTLYNAVENVTSINQILTELTRNCFLDSPTHPQYTNTRAVCGSLFTAAAKQTRIFIWRKAT